MKKLSKNFVTNIVLSNTQLSGFYKIVDEIKELTKKNKFENIILIVPDKFSLNAEQIFMEKFGQDAVFNVWLATISRLVNKINSEDENKFSLLSKNSGTMLVSQIILKLKDKLTEYSNITNKYSFAETMFNVINLLKSSGVRPEELKQNFKKGNFGNKLKDIYLIYSEYEKAMKDNIDAITRLQIFNNKVKNSDYIKNSHIFFAMFDSFTTVQIQTLCELAKHSKSLTLSLCANTKQPNHFIYDNTLFHRIKDFFAQNGVESLTINIEQKINNRVDFMSKNFLAYDETEKFETDDVRLMECDNILQEARYVANRIKFLIMERGYTFDDINIAVNGLDSYSLELKKIFLEYDFPIYFDEQRNLGEHIFAKTFFDIANFVCGEKTTATALSIAKSPIFEIDYEKKCDFENYCKRHNVFGNDFYCELENSNDEYFKNVEIVRNNIFGKIKIFEDELNSSVDIDGYKKAILNFFDSISIERVLNNIKEEQDDIIQKQIYDEVLEKFLNILQDCDDLIGSQEMPKNMFFEMLKSVVSSTNLKTAPIRCNSVFVGDASSSTFYPRKVMFVMGSTETRMPAYQLDSGTITDKDISSFVSANIISPTVRELNKREKFKLFNLLLLATDKLELTYSTIIANESQNKSEFVTALQKIFTQSGLPLKIEKYNLEEQKIENSSSQKLPMYMVGTLKNAIKISLSNESNLKYITNKYLFNTIETEKKKYQQDKDRFVVKDTKQYLFKENKTSISQVETYFRCPFLQFINYAISPKELEKFELKASDIGNILHKVAECFVDEYIKHDYKIDDMQSVVSKIFDKVISSNEYKFFLTNKYFVEMLKDESKRFCEAIKHQVDCSEFKPVATEKQFYNYQLKNGLTFSGKIDRVDKYQNQFRIIDYKTGKEKFSFKNVYYGLKLQLIAYMKVLAEMENGDVVSTAYMPIKNDFVDFYDAEFKSFKLDGIILDDKSIIRKLDTNLNQNKKSDIINVAFTDSGEINGIYKNNILSKEQMQDIQKYSFAVMIKALDEMMGGFIEPKPYKADKSPCEYCKNKSICQYQIEQSGFRKLSKKDKESFKEKDETNNWYKFSRI